MQKHTIVSCVSAAIGLVLVGLVFFVDLPKLPSHTFWRPASFTYANVGNFTYNSLGERTFVSMAKFKEAVGGEGFDREIFVNLRLRQQCAGRAEDHRKKCLYWVGDELPTAVYAYRTEDTPGATKGEMLTHWVIAEEVVEIPVTWLDYIRFDTRHEVNKEIFTIVRVYDSTGFWGRTSIWWWATILLLFVVAVWAWFYPQVAEWWNKPVELPQRTEKKGKTN